jgi:hypothetical protein
VTQQTGTKERSAMRMVALDLGSKITYCEVKDGKVVARAVVDDLSSLDRLLGPNTAPAKVAFEACREAWAVHRLQRLYGGSWSARLVEHLGDRCGDDGSLDPALDALRLQRPPGRLVQRV